MHVSGRRVAVLARVDEEGVTAHTAEGARGTETRRATADDDGIVDLGVVDGQGRNEARCCREHEGAESELHDGLNRTKVEGEKAYERELGFLVLSAGSSENCSDETVKKALTKEEGSPPLIINKHELHSPSASSRGGND